VAVIYKKSGSQRVVSGSDTDTETAGHYFHEYKQSDVNIKHVVGPQLWPTS